MVNSSVVKSKNEKRVYYTKKDNYIEIPNLIEHQNKSFSWLVQEGLGELFAEISPIEDYTGAKLTLKFLDYHPFLNLLTALQSLE